MSYYVKPPCHLTTSFFFFTAQLTLRKYEKLKRVSFEPLAAAVRSKAFVKLITHCLPSLWGPQGHGKRHFLKSYS